MLGFFIGQRELSLQIRLTVASSNPSGFDQHICPVPFILVLFLSLAN